MALGCVGTADAADITLSASDGLGTSSFNTGLNWPGAVAPTAGNNYFTGSNILRTPADGASHVFAGDSLTVNTASGTVADYSTGLLYKGTGNAGVITINNLILNSGLISHANGTGDLFQLAGNINVVAPSTIYAKQGSITISSVISGSANLTVPATDDNGNGNFELRLLTLTGANTFTGNTSVAGRLRVSSTGALKFTIGASGVNNSVSGTGRAEFGGTFNFDLTGASATPGSSWTIANVATQTFTSTFSVAGFTKSGDFWTNGTYLFNPFDGTLSVASAPLSWNVDGGGAWNVGGNWTGGVAPGASANVVFGGVLTAANAPATVTLTAAASASRITFSNANQYKLAGPGVLTLNGLAQLGSTNGTHEISAVIAGTAGLVKTGGGGITLSADNTYTGLTDVQGGALRLARVGSVDGNATVAAGATLAFVGDSLGGGYNGVFAGDIAGAGTVLIDGSLTTETVTFSGAKSYSGQTTINGGTLAVSNAGALGVSDGTVASRTLLGGNEQKGQLALSGNINVGNELLVLAARELSAANSPHVVSTGNNSWAGNVKGEVGGSQYNLVSNSGTLTLGGVISAPDSGTRNFVFSGAGNFNVTGKITDLGSNADGTLPPAPTNAVSSVSVIKQGAGTLTIGTATNLQDDYWLGNTIVEGGTLRVLSDGANNGELWSPLIAVRAGATFDVTHFGTYALQEFQRLGGAGTVLATGKTVEVYDDNSIAPGDSVGTLTINGAMTLNGGSGGGALQYELGSTTTVGGVVNDLLNVTGALTVNGSPTMNLDITPADGGLATGTYRLISHAGGTTSLGGITPRVLNPAGNPLTIRQSLAVSGATAGQVNLVVSGSKANLTWTGAGGTAWDLNNTASWSGGDTRYFDLDSVTFNDTAGANTTVDISSSSVSPASIALTSAASRTFTFTGTQGVQGSAPVSLTGNVTAVLANANNNLTGTISVGAGTTLQQGNGSSTGTTISTGVVSGAGTIRVDSGTLQLSGANTFTGAVVVNGGVLNMDSATALGTTAAGTTINAGGTVRSNSDAYTTSEPFTLNGGALAVGGGASAALTLAGPITVNAGGGTFQVDGGGGDDALTVTSAIGGAAAGAVNANIDGGSRMTVAGAVSNNGALNKNGTGVLALAASATVSSPLVNVSNGSLDVTALGTFVVANGQTLSGSGGGVVTGNVSAASGSTIRVGSAGMPTQLVYQYLDATHGVGGNTTLSSGATFEPTTNPDWQLRTALGNNGTIYQGGSDDPASAPELKSTITGLTPGATYTVYANYWDATGSQWQIRAGTTSGALTLYDSPDDAVAGAVDGINTSTLFYATAPLRTEGNRTMYGAPMGNMVADVNGHIAVFIDDGGNASVGDGRTWYDGLSFSDGSTAAISQTMTVSGDLTLNAGSTLAIDISTPSAHDKLNVTGNLAAGGTLAVSLQAGSPTLAAGNVFDILDFASASGSFSTVSLPSLTGGLSWDTSSLLTTGQLSVVAGGLPGDFNSDTKVDGSDFLAWQRNPGVGNLSDWRTNYGAGVGPATPAVGAVPEPSTLILAACLMGATVAASRRRRGC
ncbi:MAG: autotransporter-associated beta strand repeat-containing protein [Pirellulales bacterium]|nr:autotransporter-associated beta strand repeat-containing protein [Pirellulales bacterium]